MKKIFAPTNPRRSLDGDFFIRTSAGGDGKDMFYYSVIDNHDIIFGFADDDLLQISADFTAAYDKPSKAVTFSIGVIGSVTLKEFTATTFHVNYDTYKISKNQFVKK